MYRLSLFYFCMILFKHLPLRFGITVIIHSCINDLVQCLYRRLFRDIIFYHLLWPPPNTSTWGIYNKSQILSLLEFSLTLCYISMPGGGWAKKLSPKNRIGSLSIFFAWQVCTVLFGVSGWRLICGPVTSTVTTLFQMLPLLMLWCYIMLCQK